MYKLFADIIKNAIQRREEYVLYSASPIHVALFAATSWFSVTSEKIRCIFSLEKKRKNRSHMIVLTLGYYRTWVAPSKQPFFIMKASRFPFREKLSPGNGYSVF